VRMAKSAQVDQIILRIAKTGKATYRELDQIIAYIQDLRKIARPQDLKS